MFSVCQNSFRFSNYKWLIVRFTSTSTNLQKNKKPETSSHVSLQNFTPIYKCSLIRHLGLINRIKIYQSLCTALVIPTSLILNALSLVDNESTLAVSAIGLSFTATLFTIGYFTNKLIGFVYVNKDQDIVRISYVDFWGKRQNDEVPRIDVIPICGGHLTTRERIYYILKRYSVDKTYILNLSHCEVLDEEQFKAIFGIGNETLGN